MIVFAAVAPHSPILVPTIGKDKTDMLACTVKAYAELEQSLYLAKPDTLVILSPHAQMYPDAMSGNVAPKFRGVLKEFGDHGTTVEAKADFLVLDHIHRQMRQAGIPFTMSSSEELDYGFTVPLLFLSKQLPNLKIVPLSVSLLDGAAHLNYGAALHDVLHAEPSRIAVLASADLSHHVNAQSPQGLRPEGERFDKAVRESVVKKDGNGLISALDANQLEQAGQCGFKPIAVLLGLLRDLNCTPKELCYEAPFGVGYLTARFDIA